MKNIKIVTKQSVRLDSLLQARLNKEAGLEKTPLSNSKIRRLIIAGCVYNGSIQLRVPSMILKPETCVTVHLEEEKAFYNKEVKDVKFEVTQQSVLYEDEDLIFIDKPPFFPTEPTIVQTRDNLHAAVIRYLWSKNPSLRNPPYVGIMHRLDHQTSGVIMFTKNRSVNKAVFDMFDSQKISGGNERSVRKTYIAAVEKSQFPEKLENGYKFNVELYMNRISSKSAGCRWGSVPKEKGGLYSRTEFEVMQVLQDKVVLYAHPVTGRTHQIRCHLKSLGCPIIGDSIYGKDGKRLLLHAYSLELAHPVTGLPLCVKTSSFDIEKFCL